MATDLQAPPETNVVALIKGILVDGQALLESQLELLTAEVRSDWDRTKRAAFTLLVGLVPTFAGLTLLCFMLVYLVHSLSSTSPPESGGIPLWGCFGLVGGVLAIGGAAIVSVGIGRFQAFNPLPDETAQALKENLRWLTQPK